MSTDNRFELTKKNLDLYLKEVAKEYRKLNRNGMHAEIIIVGGGSILINYSFRLSTTDIDAYTQASASFKEAVNRVSDKHALPNGWLNSDFRRTESYSDKLVQYSEYYKTFYNMVDIRTITREYLIAMKLKSGRKYKNDLSDIVGILDEHIQRNDPISLEQIQKAYEQLYGEWDTLTNDAKEFISSLFSNTSNIHDVYEATKQQENDAKEILIDFEENYPGITTESNVDSILESLKKKR